MICALDSGSLAVDANELCNCFGSLERVVGATEEVLGGLPATRHVFVEQDDATVDRNFGKSSPGDSVTACPRELPAAIGDRPHINGMDLPVALHRLANCG